MGNGASPVRCLRFDPDPEGDGTFERPQGAPIPVSAPDWDRALDLLRKFNSLQDASGRLVRSIITEDGFEPWWYGQDRFLRFYLIPLTQLIPLLTETGGSTTLRVENAPPDLLRVLQAIGGREGFPALEADAPRPADGSAGKAALLAASLTSLAAFRLARRDTAFYIVDHVSPGLRRDFRFDPLYREMERSGFRYAEYAHTLSPKQGLANFLRRRRPVFFLEAADFWARLARLVPAAPALELPDSEGASPEDRALRALIPLALDGCVHSVGRQKILKRALRLQRARRAVVFDDNRHNHELVAACRSRGVPVLGFQHGVFNKFHAGLMAYGFSGARPHAFDRYGMWSDLFRDRLLRDSALYDPQRVFVAGPVRPPDTGAVSDPESAPPAHCGIVRVLVVSEPLARKREAARFLRTLLADTSFEIYLKLRPGESAAALKEYGLPADRVRLLQTGTVYEAFARVDVAVGTYSSVLYEAALAGIPIVWMKTTRAYGRELAEEGLAEPADRPEDLPGAIRNAVAQTKDERRVRRERIWGREIRNGAVSLVETLRRMEG